MSEWIHGRCVERRSRTDTLTGAEETQHWPLQKAEQRRTACKATLCGGPLWSPALHPTSEQEGTYMERELGQRARQAVRWDESGGERKSKEKGKETKRKQLHKSYIGQLDGSFLLLVSVVHSKIISLVRIWMLNWFLGTVFLKQPGMHILNICRIL